MGVHFIYYLRVKPYISHVHGVSDPKYRQF